MIFNEIQEPVDMCGHFHPTGLCMIFSPHPVLLTFFLLNYALRLHISDTVGIMSHLWTKQTNYL